MCKFDFINTLHFILVFIIVLIRLFLLVHTKSFTNLLLHLSVKYFRSHDGFIELPSGILESDTPSSLYASQKKVFDDLGRDVLKNAFDGTKKNVVYYSHEFYFI